MPPRTKRWDKTDNRKFRDLVRSGRINPRNNDTDYIDALRREVPEWSQRSYRNFAQNYRRQAKIWLLHTEEPGFNDDCECPNR